MKTISAFLAFVAIIAVNGQPGHDHEADSHAIANQLAHIFEHDLDINKDGVTTVQEELQYFHSHDTNGDCQWSYQEMEASREHGHGEHGPIHYTEEQLRAIFVYYDTRGCTQAADGFFKCDDLTYFFGLLDSNADGQMTLAEFQAANANIAQHIASIIPTGACP